MVELKPRLLVIGARPDSLGDAVIERAIEYYDYAAIKSAGINGENYKMDVTNNQQIKEVLDEFRPDFVLCTVGINVQVGVWDPFFDALMTDAFRTNVIGPMDVLRHFLTAPYPTRSQHKKKFAVISSNSARIPRTKSIGYCASKAALSMAVRTAARELAGQEALLWGYEPGLLTTSLTVEVGIERQTMDLHRMRGVDCLTGLNREDLAERILFDFSQNSTGINGCMIPFDAGEL